MLFRPKFCANCGEKIERAEWHIWTSRRFCDVCVAEMPVHEYGPKAVVIVGLTALLAAGGSIFKGGGNDNSLPIVRGRQGENANSAPRSVQMPAVSVPVSNVSPIETNSTVVQSPPQTLAAIPIQKPATSVRSANDDVQYFCGAQTKKGTPCSRRVKGNVRCFQHQGMPAMVAGEKLRIG